ncbi:hypothetical protein MtrunA17_Chr6g0477911 [Medicago truncatula]|uniref:Uncharacterized protein n=1 Tax=Medicago truncatula TaxID=3880 RepID=A0A396HHZ2_MEDTR|nr:hypothetical protein MtrunA17_Chr6g0477911 [Medicago truncatula]
MLWLSYPFTKMLSSLASLFPMISPRAESIAPETQGVCVGTKCVSQ